MTHYGTGYFSSFNAAVAYYREYGYTNVSQAVRRKIDDGEIHIGKPETKEGETAYLNREEGRWFIREDSQKG